MRARNKVEFHFFFFTFPFVFIFEFLIAASDLESIRALFNEKEKELSVAVAKVEELTRQLEEVRRGRAPPRGQPPAALELDKLRRELMVCILLQRLSVK